MVSSLPLLSYELSVSGKGNTDGKKRKSLECKISFKGFLRKYDKYDRRYVLFTRTNKNYWVSVDVTKCNLLKVKRLPREGLIHFIFEHICLTTIPFEIVSSKKVRTKRKKTTKKGDSIKALSHLKIKTYAELVRACVLAKYLQYDKRKTSLADRSKHYMKDLENDIKENGFNNPVIFAISTNKTEKAYIYEGNYLVAA